MAKYPIGIQTFEKLRKGNYTYVDKTALVYELAKDGGYYFLSRPRRFGKSLLISTLDAYFSGKRELFTGLAMEQLEHDWQARPVFHIDMSGAISGDFASVDDIFDFYLSEWEKQYAITKQQATHGKRFATVIRAAYEATGQQVAILIDEYDSPILKNLENDEDSNAMRSKLKAFYSVLKSEDRCIYFGILTGVTRFSKVSVFSDLNNLVDISMRPSYATLCGITEEELHHTFDTPIGEMAEANGITKEECYQRLARMYDGYHFTHNAPGVYNPFSLLNALSEQSFKKYWFASGTPTFLVNAMRRTDFDLSQDFNEPITDDELANVDSVTYDARPILFQSGYLTIYDYNPRFNWYTLDFPNEEVREGFMNFLLPYYTCAGKSGGRSVLEIIEALDTADTDTVMACLKRLFDKGGNYMLYEEKSKERDFRNIVYMIFCFLDIYAEAELCTAAGRMDICCRTKDYNYIIELKMDQPATTAIKQIKANGYTQKFAGEKNPLILLGVNFSTATNSIDDWKVETYTSTPQ